MAEVSLKIDLDDAQARQKIAALNTELTRPRAIPVAAASGTAGTDFFGGGLSRLGTQVSQIKGVFDSLTSAAGDLTRAAEGSTDALSNLATRLPRLALQIGNLLKSLTIKGGAQPAWLQAANLATGILGPVGTALTGLVTTAYNLYAQDKQKREELAAEERERQAELNRMRKQMFEEQRKQYQQLNSQIANIQLGEILENFNLNASPSTDIADSWERRQNRALAPELTAEEKAVEQQRIKVEGNAMRRESLAEQIAQFQDSPLKILSVRNLPSLEEVLGAQARETRLKAARTQYGGGLPLSDWEELDSIQQQLRGWEHDAQMALKAIGVEKFTDLTTAIKQIEQAQKAYTKQFEAFAKAYNNLVDASQEDEADLRRAEEQAEKAAQAAQEANSKRLSDLLKESREETPETRLADIREKAVERYNSLMRLGLGTDEASEATVGWLRNQNTKNKQVTTHSGVVASELASVGGGGHYSAAEIQTVTQPESDRLLTKILSVLTTSKDLQTKFLDKDFDAGAILY